MRMPWCHMAPRRDLHSTELSRSGLGFALVRALLYEPHAYMHMDNMCATGTSVQSRRLSRRSVWAS